MATNANAASPVPAASVPITTNSSNQDQSQQQQRFSTPGSVAPTPTASASLAPPTSTPAAPNQSCHQAILLGGLPAVAVGGGQWPTQMVWTRRQSPEWKPRRASVASCQLQQQHHLLKRPCLPDAAAADASIRKLLSQHRHQRRLLAIRAAAAANNNSFAPDYHQIGVGSDRTPAAAADVDFGDLGGRDGGERHEIVRTSANSWTTNTSEHIVVGRLASSSGQQRQPSQVDGCCDQCSPMAGGRTNSANNISSKEQRTTTPACLGSTRIQRDLTLRACKTTTTSKTMMLMKPTCQPHDATLLEPELQHQKPPVLTARQANIGQVNRSSSMDSPKGSQSSASCVGRARRQGLMGTTSGAASSANLHQQWQQQHQQHPTASAMTATCYCGANCSVGHSCSGQQQHQRRSVISCAETAAFSSSAADVEEKLRLQDKQRKFLIFSMAFKQLMAAADQEAATIRSDSRRFAAGCLCNECRLREPSCCACINKQTVCLSQKDDITSKTVARDIPLLGQQQQQQQQQQHRCCHQGRQEHQHQQQQQPASSSWWPPNRNRQQSRANNPRVLLRGSRLSLVDRLLVTGSISSANSIAAAACSIDSAPTCCQVSAIDSSAACSTKTSSLNQVLSSKHQPPPKDQHQEQYHKQRRRRLRRRLRQSSSTAAADDESVCGGANSASNVNKASSAESAVIVLERSESKMSELLPEFGGRSETKIRTPIKIGTIAISSCDKSNRTATIKEIVAKAREAPTTGSSGCSGEERAPETEVTESETDDSSSTSRSVSETCETETDICCDQETLISNQPLAGNLRDPGVSVKSSSNEDNCQLGSTWIRQRPLNKNQRRQQQQRQRRRFASSEPVKSDLGEESDASLVNDHNNDRGNKQQPEATMASSKPCQWLRHQHHHHHHGHQSYFDLDHQVDLELTSRANKSAFATLGSSQGSTSSTANVGFGDDLSHCSISEGSTSSTNSQQLHHHHHQQQCDLNLESLIVESWLDDHPAFVHDYFMRKANHQLVDDWLITHAKAVSNTTNLSGSSMGSSATRTDGNLLLSASRTSNNNNNNNNNNQHHHLEQFGKSRKISQHSLNSQLNTFLGGLRAAESESASSSSSPPSRTTATVIPQPSEITPTPTTTTSSISNAPGLSSSSTANSPRLSQANIVAPTTTTLAMCTTPFISAGARHNMSRSHSGANTPVRKISATDFESKTGSGFLRPMVSTTPDGRPTFLSQLVLSDDDDVVGVRRDLDLEALRQRHNRPSSQTVHETSHYQQASKSRRPSASFGPVSSNSTILTSTKLDDSAEVCETGVACETEAVAVADQSEESSAKIALTESSVVEGDKSSLADCDCSAEDDYDQENCELKLIFELVKNICNDLDIRTLLHKILKNIALLINADKSSLFLVCGRAGDPNRHLVSQLFNVDRDSELVENEPPEEGECIKIPWGTGLVGYVAESGESLNIENCYEDPRFTNTIDQRTGYVTRHMLCAPIFDKRNEIVGVAQVINKRDGNPFSKKDEIKFRRYLQFCGIGLRNAQSYEHCQLENRRNQVLLDLARMVFEEQSTIEQVVYRIMLHTQSLLECQRCQVLLIDDGSDDLEQLLQLPISYAGCTGGGGVGSGSFGITGGGLGQNNAVAYANRQSLSRRRRIGAAAAAASQAAGNQASGCGHDVDDQYDQDHEAPKPEWHPQCSSAGAESGGCRKPGASDRCQLEVGSGALSDEDGGGGVRGSPSACESEQKRRRPNCSALDSSTVADYRRQQQKDAPQSLHQAPKLFSLVFDLECEGNGDDRVVMHSSKDASDEDNPAAANSSKDNVTQSQPDHLGGRRRRSQFPINIGITGYVAMTGETLNIEDAHQCDRFDPSVDENSNFRHKSILCMPIRNGQRQIIGVSQLINKKNGRPFNKNDEDLFEAFAIFCGLGIHNTLMYEKVLKIMAKQRVTFEVLSYHATAPLEEAKKLNMEQIPSCFALNLTSLKFNDFSLDEQFMLKSCLRFFLDLDLIRRFQIDQLVFCNWILSVQKNYRKVTYHPIVGGNGLKAAPVRYHNWRHAFNVSQMMFAILINTQICQPLGELETLALLIACLCHDLDHRGTNNSFQIKSASPLAELYSTSTMEHHHFDQCVMILNSQGNQILANLSPDEYSRVIVLLEEAILATDLANYFQKRETFFQLVNGNQFDWQRNSEHRSLLRCMLMTACDVAAITKPWPVQKVVADLVMSEFYQQGDIEKQELNIEPIDMMNRDKMSKLPEMQIGFIDSICAPIYSAFAKLFPRELSPLLEGCLANRDLWANLAQQQIKELAISSSGNDNNDSKSDDKLEQQQLPLIANDLPLISYLNNDNNNKNNDNTSSGTSKNKINKSEPAISILPKGLASARSSPEVNISLDGSCDVSLGAHLLPNQNHQHQNLLQHHHHHNHQQQDIPPLASPECISDGSSSSSYSLSNASELINSETRPISAANAGAALASHNDSCKHQFSKVDYQRKSV